MDDGVSGGCCINIPKEERRQAAVCGRMKKNNKDWRYVVIAGVKRKDFLV